MTTGKAFDTLPNNGWWMLLGKEDRLTISPKQETHWPEVRYEYSPDLRTQYKEGKLLSSWVKKYNGHFLFCDRMLTDPRYPFDKPKEARGFNELFMAIRYIEAGYEALWYYRKVEDNRSYQKLCELLGGDQAGHAIAPNSEKGGTAPDLIVFEPGTGRFRFVECKGKWEPFTTRQIDRFAGIETYLNDHPPAHAPALSVSADENHQELFPTLPTGQWIHVARVVPLVGPPNFP